MKKTCGLCLIEKDVSEFSPSKECKFGVRPQCKMCRTKDIAKYYKENPNQIILRNEKTCTNCNVKKNNSEFPTYLDKRMGKLRIRNICKLCIKNGMNVWKSNNTEQIKETRRQYQLKNKEKIKEQRKQYRLENKEKIRQYDVDNWQHIKEHKRQYRQNNVNVRLAYTLRVRILLALSGKCKSESTLQLLGCGVDEFKQYLENQFDENMNWSNYGSYWEIDHIKPCNLFDLSKSEQQKECFHYTNTQPMERIENIIKSDKLPDGTRAREHRL